MSEHTPASDETLTRITELARQALQAQASFARQSLELGRATLAGDVDRTTTGRAYLDAVSREGARYWREVGALGLDYAGELMALGSRTAARIISDTSAAGARAGRRDQARRRGPTADDAEGGSSGGATGSASGEPGGARRLAVTLRAAPGETARASVTVANRHPRTRRVVLRPSELRDLGGTAIAVALTVDPDQVTIPAGGEEQVELAAELAADLVQPGERYLGTVEVSGGDEATLDVTVEVAS
ncbi:hypothetical protein [Nostocoides sp. HKS02]|uniref:hypothetical protein n=1 Tax=Nostocoides sp. HKS02 TaxID=1813880 RepID=UPI0012B4742C|nr:hypothetical protein [Tetrasphaera sp. HKS02]QGN58455.1 hypothetical protein GKE56_11805 [Tetrasphaera sp. HKS02]